VTAAVDAPNETPGPARPRRRPPWKAVGAAAAVCAVAGATIGVLFATHAIGGDSDTPLDRPAPAKAAVRATGLAPLPALPTADLVDDAGNVGDLGMARLLHSVVLVAGQTVDPGSEPINWAVYAIPGDDATSVCREIEAKWLPTLQATMSEDRGRAETLQAAYEPTGDGCLYSYTETTPLDSTGGVPGPLSYDIAVRTFEPDDPDVNNVAARRGALGAVTPDQAGLYRAPYVEVSRVLTRNPPDVAYMDGSLASEVADEAQLADLAGRIADVITYSRRGRAYSQARDFRAAERNRRETLRKAKRLTENLGDNSPLWDSVSWLQTSAQASLDAVLAFEACGGTACAPQENQAATDAKERFVEAFNPYARQYLGRTYVATDL
jgi:hypothetical protein